MSNTNWSKTSDQKWPALYDRKSGFIEIIDFKIVFTGEYGRAVEIPVNQLQIKIRGENSVSYQLIDRYDTDAKITIQNSEPLEILARRGINEAKVALMKSKRKWSFKFLRYAFPFVFVILGFLALPYILSAAPNEWLDTLFTPAQEKKIGEMLFDSAKSQFEIDQDSKATKPLQDLVDHLVQANPTLAQHKPVIYVSRSHDVNAFATAGGIIICNRGLIEKAQSLEEIIGVLAHELGHVELRHVSRSMLTALGTTGSVIVLSALVGGDVATVISQMSGVLQLKYSRSQEQKADDRGFTLLVKSNVSPAGLVTFFKKLEVLPSVPSSVNLSFLSTHPLTRERIESIEAKLEAYVGTKWTSPPGSLAELQTLLNN